MADLSKATRGESFVLMGGDCAESFSEFKVRLQFICSFPLHLPTRAYPPLRPCMFYIMHEPSWCGFPKAPPPSKWNVDAEDGGYISVV